MVDTKESHPKLQASSSFSGAFSSALACTFEHPAGWSGDTGNNWKTHVESLSFSGKSAYCRIAYVSSLSLMGFFC